MNKHDILNALANVDVYSQLSCLGSMQYVVSSEAIRRAAKLIPDHPTPENVEAFLNEERNLKLDTTYAGRDEHGDLVNTTTVNDVSTTPGNHYEERRYLAALLDLRRDLLETSDELGAALGGAQMEERTLLNTMQFMLTQQKPDKAYYARQYTTNMRLGMKNYGQTRAEYVEQEMLRSVRLAEIFAAKGEHAVQFLEGLDPIEGPLDERLTDSLAHRCVTKLIARRVKIGQSLSWRAEPKLRTEAEADILFIENAIVALGGEVPMEATTPPEVEVETVAPIVNNDLMQQFAAFIASQQNPKLPGPVTIIKH